MFVRSIAARSFFYNTLFLLGFLIITPACSSDDGNDGGNDKPNPGEGCTGDITNCALGTLSDAQRGDVCNLTLAAIDSPSGATFECKSGPAQGRSLSVNDKSTCVAQTYTASCSVKVSTLLNCYKAAKSDACTALGDEGACSAVASHAGECM